MSYSGPSKDAQQLAGKKLNWKSKNIPFNGVPLEVVGTEMYTCHQGKDIQTKAKEKYPAAMNQVASPVQRQITVV